LLVICLEEGVFNTNLSISVASWQGDHQATACAQFVCAQYCESSPENVIKRSLKCLYLAQGVGDAIVAYLVCRSSICPSDHVFHPFADIPHGSPSPDRIHNTDGQPLA
jgi:hypothetical protein